MVRIERQATPSNHATSSQGSNWDICNAAGWAVFNPANDARSLGMLDSIVLHVGDEKELGEADSPDPPCASS
jgi:hypothetical protein